jgi:hypothetical protein
VVKRRGCVGYVGHPNLGTPCLLPVGLKTQSPYLPLDVGEVTYGSYIQYNLFLHTYLTTTTSMYIGWCVFKLHIWYVFNIWMGRDGGIGGKFDVVPS